MKRRARGVALLALLACGGAGAGAEGEEAIVSIVDEAGGQIEGRWAIAVCGRHVRSARATSAEPESAEDPSLRIELIAEACDVWAGAAGRGFAWSGDVSGGPIELRPTVPAVLTMRPVDALRGEGLPEPPLDWSFEWRPRPDAEWRAVPREALSPSLTEQGVVEVAGLAPGWYRLGLTSAEWASPTIAPIEVKAGARLRLTVPLEALARLCGFVVTADGDVAETAVRWWRTDRKGEGAIKVQPDGGFCVEGLPAGVRVGMTALRRAIESPPVYATTPAFGVAVELPPVPTVRGRVELDDEPPAPGTVEVGLFTEKPPFDDLILPPLVRRRVEDSEGRFEIEVMPSLRYRLVFSAEGLAPAVVAVDGNDPPQDLVVELGPGTEIEVFVETETTGEPVEGAAVVVQCRNEDAWTVRRSALSDEEGEARLAEVPPGDCRIVARHADYAPAEAEVSVGAADVEVPLTLSLGRQAVILGRVVDASGDRPVAGASVTVQELDLNAPARSARSADDGSFRVGGLAAVLHRVEVRHAAAGVATELITAHQDEGPPAILRLTSTAAISGEVRGPQGPAAGARVLVLAVAGQRFRGRTAVDGSFRFAEVPTGRIDVDVSLTGTEPWCRERFEVVAGDPNHFLIECRPAGFEVRVIDPAERLQGGSLLLIGADASMYTPSRRDGEAVVYVGVHAGDYELVEILPPQRRVLWRGRLVQPDVIVLTGR